MKHISKLFIITVLSITSITNLFAQKETKLFKDTVDGAFDISKYLLELHGFIPILAPITEPAVGYGLAVAGVYFVPKKSNSDNVFRMPDIVGGGGGFTQNKTWFAGGGYFGFWKDDRLRYRGVIGYGDINLKYFGSGSDILANNPAEFSMRSLFFLQQAMARVATSNFFLGAKYMFMKTEVTAFEESKLPAVDSSDFYLSSSGFGVIGEYETFKNVLSPTKGVRINLAYNQFLEALGSDKNYYKLTFFTHAYYPFYQRWVAGLRVESNYATGNTPFYAKPYIALRGVPILRYQGELTMLAETEHLVTVYKRWSVVGFAGIGNTIPSISEKTTGPVVWNAGAGFRYKVARLLGLQMGLDVARGPEDWAFYIVFGSAWLK